MKGLFKNLDSNPDQIHSFMKWAREMYTPFEPINGVWHPVVQAECVIMNCEVAEYEGKWPQVDLP
jgi:hypothetical protein